MSVLSLHRRSVRIVIALVAALSAAAGVSSSALAAHPAPQRLQIVRPYHTDVSGTIFFLARGIGGRAVRVVFLIDGRPVWSAAAATPRLRRALAINTRRLRNGRHVLAVRVVYANHRVGLARKTIVVRNRRPAHGAKAHSAGAGHGGAGAAGPSAAANTGAPGSGSGGPSAYGPPSGGASGASVAEFNRETYMYRTTLSTSDEANRYQFMVLSGDEHAEIPLLKAINPNLKFLLYQAIWMTNRNDYSWMQTVTGCTPYADDMANHPSWFLHDQNGNLIQESGHSDVYALDVGNAALQQECATNAAALARQYGFDGVFFDLVAGKIGDAVTPGVSVPEYPTWSSWENAMNSALSYIAPALRAQNLLVFGNVSGADSTATWEQWVGHLDGLEEESWTDGSLGLAQQIPFWSTKLTELNWAMANGKYEMVHSYNTSEDANTFGLAAMLLAANGHASYSATNGATTDEYWFPEYDTAKSLGAPAGSYTVLGNGVYERAFADGIVLVNPTGNPIPTFSLGGGAYSGSGLTGARSVAMRPTSGLILLKTG